MNVRVLTLNGCFVPLLSGKTKVPPMKGFSIPRLELLGCFINKVDEFCKSGNSFSLWCSECVLLD